MLELSRSESVVSYIFLFQREVECVLEVTIKPKSPSSNLVGLFIWC